RGITLADCMAVGLLETSLPQDGRRHRCRSFARKTHRKRIRHQRTRTTPRACRGTRSGDQRREGVMEIILLGIYGFFVWLIFFKFKWLPWNFTSQFIVITLPIVAMMALFLLLNISAPATPRKRKLGRRFSRPKPICARRNSTSRAASTLLHRTGAWPIFPCNPAYARPSSRPCP